LELRLGRLIVCVPEELFRITGLEFLELLEGRLARGFEGTLLRLFGALAGCWALGAEAGFGACCFAEEELLDFRLFLPFCADTGSVNNMKAEASTTKANVSFCWYFGLYMILLLS